MKSAQVIQFPRFVGRVRVAKRRDTLDAARIIAFPSTLQARVKAAREFFPLRHAG